MNEIVSFLKEMISLPGLSAYEKPVSDKIAEMWKPLADELSVSRLGSLHAVRHGCGEKPRPRILISAHMDAIGLMATTIEDGFIHFTEIGGIDPRILPGQPVIIHGRIGLPGVVVQPPGDLLPPGSENDPISMDRLLIDTGLRPDEVEKLVRPGDIISFSQLPLELLGNIIAGHSLDNRASVAALTVCLQELQHIIHKWDVWIVASSQEEETLGGAFTSPFEIKPQIAIAVDVTFAKGPGVSDYRGFPLGKGIALGHGPNIHPAIHKAIKDLAERLEIPFQLDALPAHSGTDAMGLQITEEGIPTMVISIPLRYMHTPVEAVALKDIDRVGRLLAEFIARLATDFTDKICWDE